MSIGTTFPGLIRALCVPRTTGRVCSVTVATRSYARRDASGAKKRPRCNNRLRVPKTPIQAGNRAQSCLDSGHSRPQRRVRRAVCRDCGLQNGGRTLNTMRCPRGAKSGQKPTHICLGFCPEIRPRGRRFMFGFQYVDESGGGLLRFRGRQWVGESGRESTSPDMTKPAL